MPPTANLCAPSRNSRRSIPPCTYRSNRFRSSCGKSHAFLRSMGASLLIEAEAFGSRVRGADNTTNPPIVTSADGSETGQSRRYGRKGGPRSLASVQLLPEVQDNSTHIVTHTILSPESYLV